MREELLKAIKEDEELLNLFLIVKLNNFTLEEQKKGKARTKIDGAFNYLSYDDLIYYDYLISKWKTYTEDNIKEIVEEELKERVEDLKLKGNEPTEEEIAEARENLETLKLTSHKLYLADLEELKENIDLEFITKALFVIYDLVIFSDLVFLHNLGDIVKTLEDHSDEEIATDLKKLIRDIVKARGKQPLETSIDTIKASLSEAEIEDYSYYFHLCRYGETIKKVAIAHAKGKLLAHPKERALEKINAFLIEPNKESVETFIATLEDALEIKLTGLTNEELIRKLATFISKSITYSRQVDEAQVSLNTMLHELKEKHRVDIVKVDNEDEVAEAIDQANEERHLELAKKYDKVKKHLALIDATEFIEDEDKNLAIKEVFRGLASNNELIAEVIDFRPVKNEDDPRNFLESLDLNKKESPLEYTEASAEVDQKEDLAITEEELEEAKLNKWTKTNTNAVNNDIKNASQRIANFNEKPIASKIKRLKELDALQEPTEEELIERKELKKEVDTLLEEKASLEERLEEANIDLQELREDYLNERDPKSKKELGRLIKSIEKDTNKLKTTIDEKFTKTNSYLQLSQDFTTGEEMLVSNEGNLSLAISNNDLSKYSAEVERLAYYIETIFYYTLEEDRDGYYLINIEDYAEKTGRVVSTKLKRQIEDALEVLRKEEFTIKKEYKGFNVRGKIRRVGDVFTIEPKKTYENVENPSRKTNYIITLEKTYRTILWHNKANYWASIPSAIMKLKNPITRGLGFYLYETLKKGIKEPGYYVRKFYLKTIVDALNKRGLLATNTSNKYSRRVIEPLRDAFNELVDIGLITYDEENEDNAFKFYEDHLRGTKNLERTFEEKSITIKFLVYDKALYDRILQTNRKYAIENKKKKTRAKNKQKND